MTDIHDINTYDYRLPHELIAAYPAMPRDAARLLVWPARQHEAFSDLIDYMKSGDVLVLNSSKVIPARIFGIRPKRDETAPDVNVEFLLHKPQGDFTTWTVFAKPAKRLKENDTILFVGDMTATVMGREDDQVMLRFNCKPDEVEMFLQTHGHMPLPPYIHRRDEPEDKEEYQTVYAKTVGSVAAPTAGLHFTEELLQKLKAKGVTIVEVTLHVGAGTFLSVTVDDIREHKMHAEWGRISADTANIISNAQKSGKKIFAVGTTATRLLETAARETGKIAAWEGDTDIFITPGFKFNVVDRLITNFHLPKSTLLMLVAAFVGPVEEAQAIYAFAIENEYRFYSYGDACLLTRGR